MSKLPILLKKLEDLQNQIEAAAKVENDSKKQTKIQRTIFASKVKAYRIKHNLTQEQLAGKLGITRVQLLRWEKARRTPSKLAMIQLIKTGIIKE